MGGQGPRRLLAALLVRDGGSSDWGVSSGYGKKWTDVGHVLEMEPVGLADGVDAGNDVKGESKGDAEVWGPRPRWMYGGATYQDRGSPGEACWGSLIRSSVPAMLSVGCLVDLAEGHGVGISTKPGVPGRGPGWSHQL